MATLLVRGVPDDLYTQLKHMAGLHRRSLNQEAVQCLKAGVAVETSPGEKPDWEEFTAFMQDAWSIPVVDTRTPDEIIGYKSNGLIH